MTVSLSLPPDLEAKLRERAAAAGKDPSQLVSDIVQQTLRSPPSFKEIFRPLHEAFEEGSAGDEELNSLFEQLREQVWQEHRGKRAS